MAVFQVGVLSEHWHEGGPLLNPKGYTDWTKKLPFINTYSGWFLNSVMLVGKGFSSSWSGGLIMEKRQNETDSWPHKLSEHVISQLINSPINNKIFLIS